jgi:hypothetical protein
MHMSGMAEMVRVRGGMTAIRRELQMKIYRYACPLPHTLVSWLHLVQCQTGSDEMIGRILQGQSTRCAAHGSLLQ